MIIGSVFSSSIERYIYKGINLIPISKKCKNNDFINFKSTQRIPVRMDNIIETNEDWLLIEKNEKLCLKSTAILLIDVWDTENEKNEAIKSKYSYVTTNVIKPVVEKIRKNDGLIIHHANARVIASGVFSDNDIDLSWSYILPMPLERILLMFKLKLNGIDTIIYSGFSTSICLFDRPVGISKTKKFRKYFKSFLLKDGTANWEFSNNNPNFTENLIKFIEWKHIPSIESKFILN